MPTSLPTSTSSTTSPLLTLAQAVELQRQQQQQQQQQQKQQQQQQQQQQPPNYHSFVQHCSAFDLLAVVTDIAELEDTSSTFLRSRSRRRSRNDNNDNTNNNKNGRQQRLFPRPQQQQQQQQSTSTSAATAGSFWKQQQQQQQKQSTTTALPKKTAPLSLVTTTTPLTASPPPPPPAQKKYKKTATTVVWVDDGTLATAAAASPSSATTTTSHCRQQGVAVISLQRRRRHNDKNHNNTTIQKHDIVLFRRISLRNIETVEDSDSDIDSDSSEEATPHANKTRNCKRNESKKSVSVFHFSYNQWYLNFVHGGGGYDDGPDWIRCGSFHFCLQQQPPLQQRGGLQEQHARPIDHRNVLFQNTATTVGTTTISFVSAMPLLKQPHSLAEPQQQQQQQQVYHNNKLQPFLSGMQIQKQLERLIQWYTLQQQQQGPQMISTNSHPPTLHRTHHNNPIHARRTRSVAATLSTTTATSSYGGTRTLEEILAIRASQPCHVRVQVLDIIMSSSSNNNNNNNGPNHKNMDSAILGRGTGNTHNTIRVLLGDVVERGHFSTKSAPASSGAFLDNQQTDDGDEVEPRTGINEVRRKVQQRPFLGALQPQQYGSSLESMTNNSNVYSCTPSMSMMMTTTTTTTMVLELTALQQQQQQREKLMVCLQQAMQTQQPVLLTCLRVVTRRDKRATLDAQQQDEEEDDDDDNYDDDDKGLVLLATQSTTATLLSIESNDERNKNQPHYAGQPNKKQDKRGGRQQPGRQRQPQESLRNPQPLQLNIMPANGKTPNVNTHKYGAKSLLRSDPQTPVVAVPLLPRAHAWKSVTLGEEHAKIWMVLDLVLLPLSDASCSSATAPAIATEKTDTSWAATPKTTTPTTLSTRTLRLIPLHFSDTDGDATARGTTNRTGFQTTTNKEMNVGKETRENAMRYFVSCSDSRSDASMPSLCCCCRRHSTHGGSGKDMNTMESFQGSRCSLFFPNGAVLVLERHGQHEIQDRDLCSASSTNEKDTRGKTCTSKHKGQENRQRTAVYASNLIMQRLCGFPVEDVDTGPSLLDLSQRHFCCPCCSAKKRHGDLLYNFFRSLLQDEIPLRWTLDRLENTYDANEPDSNNGFIENEILSSLKSLSFHSAGGCHDMLTCDYVVRHVDLPNVCLGE